MTRPHPGTLDHEIALIGPKVAARLRDGLRDALRTLRDARSPQATFFQLYPIGSYLVHRILTTARKPASGALGSLTIGLSKAKIQGLLPGDIEGHLKTINGKANVLKHNPRGSAPSTTEAEASLFHMLRAVDWFYCTYDHGPKLLTIFDSKSPEPVTLVGRTYPLIQQLYEMLGTDLARDSARQLPRFAGPRPIVGSLAHDVGAAFRGRADELADLRRFLQDDAAKIVCVVGRGGMGKTALVAQVCSEVERHALHLSQFEPEAGAKGIIYFACSGPQPPTLERLFRDVEGMLGGLAAEELRYLWLDDSRTIEEKIAELLFRLRDGSYLLVLDNLDTLLGPDGLMVDANLSLFLNSVIRIPHGLRVLATSREQPIFAASASFSHAVRVIHLDRGLSEDEAIALVWARDPQGVFGVRNVSHELLRELARRCFGIPLALVRVVGILSMDHAPTIEQLLADDELFGDQVVENLIAEQYLRLNRDHQLVLQALSVFGNRVSNSAVRYLVHAFHPDVDVVACLDTLVRSLFVFYDRNVRLYELHQLDQIHCYGSITDTEATYNRRSAHRCVADYYLQLRPPDSECTSLVHFELFALEVAHLLRAGAGDVADKRLEPYVEGLLNRQVRRGKLDQAMTFHSQMDFLRRTYGAWPGAGRLSNELGLLYRRAGLLDEAKACYDQAISILVLNSQPIELADAYAGAGLVQETQGDLNAAFDFYQRAEDTYPARHPRGNGKIAHCLGRVFYKLGVETEVDKLYTEVGKLYDDAIVLYSEVGIPHHLMALFSDYASLERRCGNFEKAFSYWQKSLDLSVSDENDLGSAVTLYNVGQLHREVGNSRHAVQVWKSALILVDATTAKYAPELVALCSKHNGDRTDLVDELIDGSPWEYLKSQEVYRHLLARVTLRYLLAEVIREDPELGDYKAAVADVSDCLETMIGLSMISGTTSERLLALSRAQGAAP